MSDKYSALFDSIKSEQEAKKWICTFQESPESKLRAAASRYINGISIHNGESWCPGGQQETIRKFIASMISCAETHKVNAQEAKRIICQDYVPSLERHLNNLSERNRRENSEFHERIANEIKVYGSDWS